MLIDVDNVVDVAVVVVVNVPVVTALTHRVSALMSPLVWHVDCGRPASGRSRGE